MRHHSQLFQKGGPPVKTRKVTPLLKTRSRGGAPIDKSALTIGAPKRNRDEAYRRWVAEQPSAASGRAPCQAHHLKWVQPRARGLKTTDEALLPLTPDEHDEVERFTRKEDELAWWAARGVADPEAEARTLRWRWENGRGELV